MSQHRRLTSSAVVIAAITTLSWPGPVSAAETSELESLRREVRQLQSDLQVLRTAVTEATELERLRSDKMAKLMRETQAAPASEPSPPVATTEAAPTSRQTSAAPAPVAAAAAAAAEEKPARTKHRKQRHKSGARSKASKGHARN